MAAESNAQLAEAYSKKLERVDLDGLERVDLDGLEAIFSAEQEELFEKGLSIKQAVYYYGETRKSLKSKLQEGSIPAIRLPDSYGKKWRIFPDGVPEKLQSLLPRKLRKTKKENLIALEKESTVDFEAVISEPALLEETISEPILKEAISEPALKEAVSEAVLKEPISEPVLKEPISEPVLEEAFSEAVPKEAISEPALEETISEAVLKETELDFAPEPIAFDCRPPAAFIEEKTDAEKTEFESAAPKKTNRYAQLADRITELEKELEKATLANNYLESRIAGLEDQVKFLSQNHYQSRSFNKMLLVIPGLLLIASLFFFRFSPITTLSH